jgi:hypothetical protein
LALTVRTERNHPRRPATPFVTRRAGTSDLGFPCGPPSAATTAAAPCSPIQAARVTTSAGLRCRIYRSQYCSSEQTGANSRPLGECHDNHCLACSHHAVPELVSPGEVYPMTVQKLHDASGEGLLTASISIACLALQTCFRCSIASIYQLAHGQSLKEAAREVYCLEVRPAQ